MEIVNIFQPNDVNEAKEMLSSYENIRLIAGGTDLLLELREEVNTEYLINLGNLKELKEITEDDSVVIIGSMVTFSELLDNHIIKFNFHSIHQSASTMGSPQIRNMATIGGNIINGGSAADIIPCIMSLDGSLILESKESTREIKVLDYFQNYDQEKIKDNELLTKIIIPKGKGVSGYYKLGKRNSLAIARINTAIYLEVEDDLINRLSVCLGAVGRYPFNVGELEKQAIGQKTSWLSSEEAMLILENTVRESIKGRKTMPFKREAIKGVFKEALKKTKGDKQ